MVGPHVCVSMKRKRDRRLGKAGFNSFNNWLKEVATCIIRNTWPKFLSLRTSGTFHHFLDYKHNDGAFLVGSQSFPQMRMISLTKTRLAVKLFSQVL